MDPKNVVALQMAQYLRVGLLNKEEFEVYVPIPTTISPIHFLKMLESA